MHKDLFDLSGRVAVVTGGSRGLGEIMSRSLAEAGAAVVIASRKQENCARLADELSAKGFSAMAIALNVKDENDINKMVETVLARFGKIDILVNNAGISPFMAEICETRADGWDKVMEVNLKGAFLCAKVVGKVMKRQKNGKILNISSNSANLVVRELGAYSVSKAGLLHLTRLLAEELGPYNINVNAIAPGFMDRGIADLIPDKENFLGQLIPRTALRRTGKAEELVGSLLLLTSEAGSYITGQTLFIDGGASAV